MAVNSGIVMCVLFYGQLASFASLPSQLVDESENTKISALFSKVTQFGSILSVYGNSCYGLNMGAFEATAAQLSGPAIVLSATLLLTAVAKRLMLRLSYFLQKFNFEAEISFGNTIFNVLLLLFSSASSAIFQLITRQQCCESTPDCSEFNFFYNKEQSPDTFDMHVLTPYVANVTISCCICGLHALYKQKMLEETFFKEPCSKIS